MDPDPSRTHDDAVDIHDVVMIIVQQTENIN